MLLATKALLPRLLCPPPSRHGTSGVIAMRTSPLAKRKETGEWWLQDRETEGRAVTVSSMLHPLHR